jgi:hypothetical protein
MDARIIRWTAEELSGTGGGAGTVALRGHDADAIGTKPVPTRLAPVGNRHRVAQARRRTGNARIPRMKLE